MILLLYLPIFGIVGNQKYPNIKGNSIQQYCLAVAVEMATNISKPVSRNPPLFKGTA
jgi:hypothetical protein